jgi:hypothetical protein
MANHGLRTTGRPTGNFGRNKVQGKPGDLDLTKEILNKDNLRIPQRDQAYDRLWEAYSIATDPKLKSFLSEMLKKRLVAIQRPEVKPMEKPPSPYWDSIKLTR